MASCRDAPTSNFAAALHDVAPLARASCSRSSPLGRAMVLEDAISASYVQIGRIGRGVYGEAILLRHCSTGEKVVVKHIPLDGLEEDEVGCALKEVAALNQLNHPNIVKCHGSWVTNGCDDDGLRPWDRGNEASRRPIDEALSTWAAAQADMNGPSPSSLNILTEYVDGGSLDKLIARNGPFREFEAGIWLAQIVLAVDHMHARHLLHRDIKPANVFITRSGVIKVGDLGCCKMLERPDEECRSDYGSPIYLSPEVWRHGVCSHKSDVWAQSTRCPDPSALSAQAIPPALAQCTTPAPCACCRSGPSVASLTSSLRARRHSARRSLRTRCSTSAPLAGCRQRAARAWPPSSAACSRRIPPNGRAPRTSSAPRPSENTCSSGWKPPSRPSTDSDTGRATSGQGACGLRSKVDIDIDGAESLGGERHGETRDRRRVRAA